MQTFGQLSVHASPDTEHRFGQYAISRRRPLPQADNPHNRRLLRIYLPTVVCTPLLYGCGTPRVDITRHVVHTVVSCDGEHLYMLGWARMPRFPLDRYLHSHVPAPSPGSAGGDPKSSVFTVIGIQGKATRVHIVRKACGPAVRSPWCSGQCLNSVHSSPQSASTVHVALIHLPPRASPQSLVGECHPRGHRCLTMRSTVRIRRARQPSNRTLPRGATTKEHAGYTVATPTVLAFRPGIVTLTFGCVWHETDRIRYTVCTVASLLSHVDPRAVTTCRESSTDPSLIPPWHTMFRQSDVS